MMELTPKNKILRLRHAPTPKLSERKKKLFSDTEVSDASTSNDVVKNVINEEDEDSDLGPMSLLQSSSSPSSFNQFHSILKRSDDHFEDQRTDFIDILKKNEIERKYSLKKLTINLGQKVSIENKIDNDTNSDVEDAVIPLCTSLKKMTGVTDSPFHRSDLLQNDDYAQQMKTPNELSTSIMGTDKLLRGLSFRKSLIFDKGLTPHNDDSISNGKNDNDIINNERPKAKTSLTFNEPTISTKSFYGSPATNENSILKRIDVHKLNWPTLSIKSKTIKKSIHKKAVQRSKVPSLWRNSGVFKPMHLKHRHITKKLSNKSTNIISMTKSRDFKSAQSSRTKRSISTKAQQKNVHKILKDQTNAGPSNSNAINNSSRSFNTSDDENFELQLDDIDDSNDDPLLKDNEIEKEKELDETINDEQQSKRKFFKSKENNTAKRYRIMNGFTATLKRGGDLKLEMPAKRPKRNYVKRQETIFLHKEITGIIDRLSSPGKSKPIDATNTESTEQIREEYSMNQNCSDIVEDVHEEVQISNENINTFQEISSCLAAENITFMNIFRKRLPYNTKDADKIAQQESILELLITNDICNEETFKIFIAEPDLHKEKASQILDNLYTCLPESNDDNTDEMQERINWSNQNEMDHEMDSNAIHMAIPNNIPNRVDTINVTKNIDIPMSPASQISNMTSSLALDCVDEQERSAASATKLLFPIFQKKIAEPKANRELFSNINIGTSKWKPIGNQQYQIDAGQKEFGIKQCPQCEMNYSVHEPEDELLHIKYHNSVHILTFKGWNNERMVTDMPQWGLNGRIIYVCETDNKIKKNRIKDLLSVVDRDLGFSTCEMAPRSIVYLAIAKNQIIGVCVVQPLDEANRLIVENNLDCCTIATFPAKCGISRIWVAPPYRRSGIASTLISTLRGHFIFGSFLSFDEIAFSSPTDAGKKFATKLTGRNDFLVYER